MLYKEKSGNPVPSEIQIKLKADSWTTLHKHILCRYFDCEESLMGKLFQTQILSQLQ
jgi:hypothetical protein